MTTSRFAIRPRRARPDDRISIVGHLDELRRRLIISAIALVVAFAGMYAVHERLIDLLTRPLPAGSGPLVTLSPTEPFFTSLKVSLWAAVLITLPVLLYQAYAFVIPAVAEQPRRVMLGVVGALVSLFAAGAAFGYAVVLPFALDFLVNFGGDAFSAQLRAGEYLGFAMSMTLAAGLMFEIPLVMAGLARMGLASAALFRSQWRVAVVVMAVVAAVLPGGDPISMGLLMLPQVLLYGAGIVLAARVGRPAPWRPEAWTGD